MLSSLFNVVSKLFHWWTFSTSFVSFVSWLTVHYLSRVFTYCFDIICSKQTCIWTSWLHSSFCVSFSCDSFLLTNMLAYFGNVATKVTSTVFQKHRLWTCVSCHHRQLSFCRSQNEMKHVKKQHMSLNIKNVMTTIDNSSFPHMVCSRGACFFYGIMLFVTIAYLFEAP